MSLYEAETSWAEVPKGLSDLGPKWKKAEVTRYPAEYYGFAIFHIMIYIYFIAALSHRQRLNSYYVPSEAKNIHVGLEISNFLCPLFLYIPQYCFKTATHQL